MPLLRRQTGKQPGASCVRQVQQIGQGWSGLLSSVPFRCSAPCPRSHSVVPAAPLQPHRAGAVKAGRRFAGRLKGLAGQITS